MTELEQGLALLALSAVCAALSYGCWRLERWASRRGRQ
jgi:hypothetical protein